VQDQGGVAAVERENEAKAKLIYDAIDATDFYRGHADVDCRSNMNVTFRLPAEDLEKKFVTEATAQGLDGLKGHRSVGGIRASIYNAFPRAGVEALVSFMNDFKQRHG
jgi:phosphoserine aminotransferase